MTKEIDFIGRFLNILLVFSLLTINILKVVSFGAFNFNASIADILILPIIFMSLRNKTLIVENKRIYFSFIILIFWIMISGLNAIFSTTIYDKSFLGIFPELIKTIICICYFYIGDITSKLVKKENIKRIMFYSFVIFWFYGIFKNTLILFFPSSRFIDITDSLFFTGSYTDPNHAATYLGITAILFLTLSICEKKTIRKFIWLFGMIVSVALLFLTDSRGGILSFLIGIFIYLILYLKKNLNSISYVIIFIIIIINIVCVFNIVYSDGSFLGNLINSLANLNEGFDERTSLSNVAFRIGMDNPIFGVGRGNYSLNSLEYFKSLNKDYLNTIPHNTLLGLFSELGIVGIVLFIFPLVMIVSKFLKELKQNNERNSKFYHVGNLVVVSLLIVFFQSLVLNLENQRILWLLLGMLLNVNYFITDKKEMINDNLVYVAPIKTNLNKINIFFIGLLILVTIYLFQNYYFYKSPHELIESNYIWELPTDKLNVNDKYIFSYNINAVADGFESDIVEIKMIEESLNNNQRVIETQMYSQVYGKAEIEFDKKFQNSRIKVIVSSLKPDNAIIYFKPIMIKDDNYYIDLEKKHLINLFKFKDVSNRFEEFKEKKLLNENAEEVIFASSIRVHVYEFFENDEKVVFTLKLKFLSDYTGDLIFWCNSRPDNVNLLNVVDQKYGFVSLVSEVDYNFENKKYNEGDEVILKYSVNKIESDILVNFGIVEIINERTIELETNKIKQKEMILGWILGK